MHESVLQEWPNGFRIGLAASLQLQDALKHTTTLEGFLQTAQRYTDALAHKS